MQHSAKPESYYLRPSILEKTDFRYNGEKDIFLELPRIIAYYEQGSIKTTIKDRVIASTLSKMQRTLKLTEFFENTKDKALKNLRTNVIASLFVSIGKLKYDGSHSTLLEKMFHLYKKDYYFISFPRLLPYIKGTNSLEDNEINPLESYIYGMLQDLPLEEWVSLHTIEKAARYRLLVSTPVNIGWANEKLYVNKPSKKYHGRNTERVYIQRPLYNDTITLPLLKANFFLFAAFGLVEIAYNQPDTAEITETYFSPYDGLQFVKLTNLGAYIVGKKQKYQQIEGTEQKPLILSKDSLMILSDETDTTADILLQKYAKKVGANRYQTDAAIFLKDCETNKQLGDKIEDFMELVEEDLPANWSVFLEELLDKLDPFEDVKDEFMVLRIPTHKRELIQLIAQDPVLKKLVSKGEGFLLFVPKSNLPKFKNRLKEFGFLLEK